MISNYPPLVGRTAEVAAIRALLDSAASGTGAVLVISGEPGAGKSRLAQHAADTGIQEGFSVHIGYAYEHAVERVLGVALNAFDLRLDQLIGSTSATRIVFEIGATGAAEFLLSDRLLEVVENSCSAHPPVLLVLEDMHWSDLATLTWIKAVAERAHDLPLAVLITTRPLPSNTAPAAIRNLPAQQTTLAQLTDTDVLILATQQLAHAPDPATMAALSTTRGNPMLIQAILAVPGATTDPIAERLHELEAGALGVLQGAAILGTRIDPVLLASMLELSTREVLTSISQAAAAGIVEADLDRFAFRHELYRAAALATLSKPAASVLHLRAAQTLAAADADALDIAEHYAQGGRRGDRDAVRSVTEAASQTVATNPAAALHLADTALALCSRTPPNELMLVRVRALAGTGRADDADLLGRSLIHDDLERSVEATLRRELAFAALILGRIDTCVEEITLHAELIDSPQARARAHGEVAIAQLMTMNQPVARAAAARAVLEGRVYGDLSAQIAGDVVICMLDLLVNQTAAATERAKIVTERAELPGAEESHSFQPWFTAAMVWLETDNLPALSTTLRRGRQNAVERGFGWAVPGYDALTAFGALRAGNFDDAAATATATLGYLDRVDGFGVAVWCHSFLAQVSLHRDNLDQAADHVSAADGWLTRQRQRQLGIEQLQLAKAGLHQRRGRNSEALGDLLQAWEVCRTLGMSSPLPAIGPAMSRLAHGAGNRPVLIDADEQLTAAATATGLASTRAIAELTGAWRRSDPDQALKAATLAATTPRPALAATALTHASELLRTRRRRQEADQIAQQAAARWAALGAYGDADACTAHTRGGRPVERRPQYGVPALTATERRIVGLVGEGLPNSAIAATVGISRRTVESHVSAAYRKLEVTSRVALARVALAHHLTDSNPAI